MCVCVETKSRVTVAVRLQTAGPLSTAMSSWVERGQHALVVDADFPDGRQPLIELVHVLLRQKSDDIKMNLKKKTNQNVSLKSLPGSTNEGTSNPSLQHLSERKVAPPAVHKPATPTEQWGARSLAYTRSRI